MKIEFIAFCTLVGLTMGTPNLGFSQRPDVEKPTTCEHLKNTLDYALVENGKLASGYLILIFRPGRGERSTKPSESRPGIISQYIKRRDPGFENLVIAQSASLSELGQLEIFVGGKRWAKLFFRKNESGPNQCIE